jgi:hypothetical protein
MKIYYLATQPTTTNILMLTPEVGNINNSITDHGSDSRGKEPISFLKGNRKKSVFHQKCADVRNCDRNKKRRRKRQQQKQRRSKLGTKN